jgi:GNAT superfamily N-acetyltransferase
MQEVEFDKLTLKEKRRVMGMYSKMRYETKELFRKMRKPQTNKLLIYSINSKIVAFASYSVHEGVKYIRKEYTFVSKKYRRRGIGARLMKYTVEKYPEYEIETIAKEFLSSFLERLGFKFSETIRVANGYKMYIRNSKK